MNEVYKAAFTIEAIENATAHELSLAITSIGSNEINLSVTLKPHQKLSGLELSFGHAEYKEHKPLKGYVFTNRGQALPFKTLKVLFERKENPVVDIPYDHTLFRHSYISYWSLYCNDILLKTYHAPENERKYYMLTLGEHCIVSVAELTVTSRNLLEIFI
jgi:hypothetical protein